jgi:hypothetical protein
VKIQEVDMFEVKTIDRKNGRGPKYWQIVTEGGKVVMDFVAARLMAENLCQALNAALLELLEEEISIVNEKLDTLVEAIKSISVKK